MFGELRQMEEKKDIFEIFVLDAAAAGASQEGTSLSAYKEAPTFRSEMLGL